MLMPISIFAFDRGSGRNVWNDPLRNVDFDWIRTADSIVLAERLASILLAGPLAEELLGPRLRRGTASRERKRDAKLLLRTVAKGRDGESSVYENVCGKTRRFLARRRVRDAVEGLACALFDRGTIRGGEAASIIESHLDRGSR
jgi:hypothetical protein